MASVTAQYDCQPYMAADAFDAARFPPPSPPMFSRPPLSASDSFVRPALRPSAIPVTQPAYLAASAQLVVQQQQQQQQQQSAFLPFHTQPFNRVTLSPSFASTTHLASPNSSPVSASTASTASSSSSGHSPQLFPLPAVSCYPLSAFAAVSSSSSSPSAPLPPLHPLSELAGPGSISAYIRPVSGPTSEDDDDDDDDSPPDSSDDVAELLPLDCDDLETTIDADTMDARTATTPVTSLLAAARSFSTAPPIPSLGPSFYLSTQSNGHQQQQQQLHHNGHTAHRISKACVACRKRKRKCDGAMPECGSCVRVGADCEYPQQTRRRGPQAGMVQKLRAQVSALESELHRERSRNSNAAAVAVAAGNMAEHANIGVLLARYGGEQKARQYIVTYFDLLNSTLFPFLVQAHFDDNWARYASNPSSGPPVWHLTVAAVLAQGAAVSGDMEYSDEAALIARAAAAPLLDQPAPDVLRGLLLLSYHCLSCNQLSRVSCFLAVATRMCAIVDMSPEVPLLCRWLEDMLCAIRTWWSGLRTMPEGSYQKEQRERFPTDWGRYERLTAYLKTHQSLPAGRHAPPASKVGSSSSSSTVALTGPPDAADLDDSNIRWEVMATLCAMTEARGEYNQDTHLSVYHHLCVLSKAEYSPLTVGAVATTIAFLKSQALFFVNELSTAIEYAKVCTRHMLTHDVAHCAFLSLVGHFLCQVHLKTADHTHLAIVLSMMRTCAERWKFAEAPLRNIEQLVQLQLEPHSTTHIDEELIPSDRDDFEPEHALPPADRSKAEEYYHSSVIPQRELHEKRRKRRLEREEAEARKSPRRPPSPSMLTALQTQHCFPSLIDTIAGFHPSFRTAFHASAGVSRGEERPAERAHSPPRLTSKEMALRRAGGELRADHPHPQLSTLKESTFTLKREEVDLDAEPEPITAAPAKQTKLVPVSEARSPPKPKAAGDGSVPSIPSLPVPAAISAAPPISHQLSASGAISGGPALSDTYAYHAGLFSPAITAISSNAFSSTFSSSHMVSYPPSDLHAGQPYYSLTGGAYSSNGGMPFNYTRQSSLDSITSAAGFPFPLEAQVAMDGSTPSHLYHRLSVELQPTDDGSGVSRHTAVPPSLSNAPHLQLSHSTPVTASMYMPLHSPDMQQHSFAAQAAPYFNPVMPPLPHAQSAPQPTSMAPYMYQPPAPYAVPLRTQKVNDVNAALGQFSDQFGEQKRKLSNDSSSGRPAH